MTVEHRLARRRAVGLQEIMDEPLLVLRLDFTLRQLFDAACQMSCLRPRLVFETSVPHALLAMARIGYGIATVPSNQVIEDRTLRRAPIVHDGKSLGQWMAVNWHPRRQLTPYAETFIAELTAHTERTYPGREFARAAPVPRPGDRKPEPSDRFRGA
jgi:LysR family transcriptional activator of glutamate synthase operon